MSGLEQRDPRRWIENANLPNHPEGRGVAQYADYVIPTNEAPKPVSMFEADDSKSKLLLERVKDKVVLDVGVSTGAVFLRDIAGVAKEVHGISPAISSEEIDKIREQCPTCNVQIASAEKMPYEDETFDYIFFVQVHRYFKNEGTYEEARAYFLSVLKEVARVLKPGGVAVFGPAMENETYRLAADHLSGGKGGNLDQIPLTEEERRMLPPDIEITITGPKDHKLSSSAIGAYARSITVRKLP